MEKEQRFRLQFFTRDGSVLAIHWANTYEPRAVQGDCFVRAIREETDVAAHNKTRHQRQRYAQPLTLEGVRRTIAACPQALGTHIHDCVGIVLEDDDDHLLRFDQPIPIRS